MQTCDGCRGVLCRQGTGLAVYTAETALRNYLTTGGSLFSTPGESPDSYRAVSTYLMLVSAESSVLHLVVRCRVPDARLSFCISANAVCTFPHCHCNGTPGRQSSPLMPQPCMPSCDNTARRCLGFTRFCLVFRNFVLFHLHFESVASFMADSRLSESDDFIWVSALDSRCCKASSPFAARPLLRA